MSHCLSGGRERTHTTEARKRELGRTHHRQGRPKSRRSRPPNDVNDYNAQVDLLDQQNKRRLLRAELDCAMQEHNLQRVKLSQRATALRDFDTRHDRNPNDPQQAKEYIHALQMYQKACRAVDRSRASLDLYPWKVPLDADEAARQQAAVGRSPRKIRWFRRCASE